MYRPFVLILYLRSNLSFLIFLHYKYDVFALLTNENFVYTNYNIKQNIIAFYYKNGAGFDAGTV